MEATAPMTSTTIDAHDWVERFDAVYRDADGDIGRVPWAHQGPCPAMVAWMNAIAPTVLRPGARIAVVGCGHGDDAVCLAKRGYDVTGIDASSQAIDWATRRHPGQADIFCVADLLDVPISLQSRFDLVVDVHTLQALPPTFRVPLATGMADLLAHGGILLAICRGRAGGKSLDAITKPPFAFSPIELKSTLAAAGLEPVRPIDDFEDDGGVRRLRATFARCSR